MAGAKMHTTWTIANFCMYQSRCETSNPTFRPSVQALLARRATGIQRHASKPIYVIPPLALLATTDLLSPCLRQLTMAPRGASLSCLSFFFFFLFFLFFFCVRLQSPEHIFLLTTHASLALWTDAIFLACSSEPLHSRFTRDSPILP
jgi:hypothetical protein